MTPSIISFHYTLTDKDGHVLGTSAGGEPLRFLQGVGAIIPRVEAELLAMNVGDKRRLTVAAAEAYGEYRPELVLNFPRAQLTLPDVKVGDRLRASGQPITFTVRAITDTHIELDGNHPLAGMDLTFDLELTGRRPATAEELASAHQCCSRHQQGGCGEHSRGCGCG